jgi:hypothetical protein
MKPCGAAVCFVFVVVSAQCGKHGWSIIIKLSNRHAVGSLFAGFDVLL